tara:strand:- start:107 stop:238 length:132 start_codon:yes stop_codon:yes gene_type:complete
MDGGRGRVLALRRDDRQRATGLAAATEGGHGLGRIAPADRDHG